MSSVNRVILLGNVGRTPERRTDRHGDTFATASLATTSQYTDRASGEKREQTEWHNLIFPPEIQEAACRDVKKGMQLFITGRLHTHKWKGRQGEDRKALQVIVQTYTDVATMGYTGAGGTQDYYAPPNNPAPPPPPRAAAPTAADPKRNEYQHRKG